MWAGKPEIVAARIAERRRGYLCGPAEEAYAYHFPTLGLPTSV